MKFYCIWAVILGRYKVPSCVGKFAGMFLGTLPFFLTFFFILLIRCFANSFIIETRLQVKDFIPDNWVRLDSGYAGRSIKWLTLKGFSEEEVAELKWHEEVLTPTPKSMTIRFEHRTKGEKSQITTKFCGLRAVPESEISNDLGLSKIFLGEVIEQIMKKKEIIAISLPLWRALFPDTPFSPGDRVKINMAIGEGIFVPVTIGHVFPNNSGDFWVFLNLSLLKKISISENYDNFFILNIHDSFSMGNIDAKSRERKDRNLSGFEKHEWSDHMIPLKTTELLDGLEQISGFILIIFSLVIIVFAFFFQGLFEEEVNSDLCTLRLFGISDFQKKIFQFLAVLIIILSMSVLGSLFALASLFLIGPQLTESLLDIGIVISPMKHIPWDENLSLFVALSLIFYLLIFWKEKLTQKVFWIKSFHK